MNEIATFGGGCFWCLDAIFRRTKGITKVTSGYSGGDSDDPNYEKIHDDETGHAESVQVEFDTNIISYDILLEIFWTSHNPTTLNQDGANHGTEYRSIIFYHNDEQKKLAEKSLHEFAEKIWDDPIVTEIAPLTRFYTAEEYHQDFYNKEPQNPYCQIVINPKLEKFRKKFADYIKE
jgi:peptide-methionine (S)-S-oxide reductase